MMKLVDMRDLKSRPKGSWFDSKCGYIKIKIFLNIVYVIVTLYINIFNCSYLLNMYIPEKFYLFWIHILTLSLFLIIF